MQRVSEAHRTPSSRFQHTLLQRLFETRQYRAQRCVRSRGQDPDRKFFATDRGGSEELERLCDELLIPAIELEYRTK